MSNTVDNIDRVGQLVQYTTNCVNECATVLDDLTARVHNNACPHISDDELIQVQTMSALFINLIKKVTRD